MLLSAPRAESIEIIALQTVKTFTRDQTNGT